MESGLEKIQNLEDSHIRNKDETIEETKGRAPMFTVPLSNVDSLREGENVHFEARVTPVDDPKLKIGTFDNFILSVDWYKLYSLNFNRMVFQQQTIENWLTLPYILRLWIRYFGDFARLSRGFW